MRCNNKGILKYKDTKKDHKRLKTEADEMELDEIQPTVPQT